MLVSARILAYLQHFNRRSNCETRLSRNKGGNEYVSLLACGVLRCFLSLRTPLCIIPRRSEREEDSTVKIAERATANSSDLISVLILTYNNFEGIYPTLDSVFQQEYPNIQIVISDDGSKHFSLERPSIEHYINDHASNNITSVVINPLRVNKGTVANTNSALGYAEGKYVISLAPEDTFVTSRALDSYVEFMNRNKDCDICFGKLRGVTPNGEYRYQLLSCDTDYDKLASFDNTQTLHHLFKRNFLPAPAAFFRKSTYEKFGAHDEDIRLIEDYPYWITVILNGGKFGYLDQYTVDYSLTGVSSGGEYSSAFIDDMFKIYEKYIFPNDTRFGMLQPLYNNLKRWGLSYYAAKAKWDELLPLQRFVDRIIFSPIHLFTVAQRSANDAKNKRANQ